MSLAGAAAADRRDAREPASARGRRARASSACPCSRRSRARRSPTRCGACSRCSSASSRWRSCCSRRSAVTAARAHAARADRARDRLVGADPVRGARAAEPDVGHARRARDRDLDRVQRAAVRAPTPGAPARATTRSRRCGAATGARGRRSPPRASRRWRASACWSLSDIRMLRDFGLVTLIDLSVSLRRRPRRPAGRGRARAAREPLQLRGRLRRAREALRRGLVGPAPSRARRGRGACERLRHVRLGHGRA